MKYNLKLYYNNGKLQVVGIVLDGVKHFTADVRGWSSNFLLFVLSKKTVEDNVFNADILNESVSNGYYVLVEKEIDVEFDFNIYTYCYIDPKYLLVDNF